MRKYRNTVWLFSLFGLALSLMLCPIVSANAQSLKRDFQSEIDAIHAQYDFPGATAAYALPDGTVEVVATGLADVEVGAPMTPRSRMLAASIGKTFVGATAIALEHEDKLHLDDPISIWLGDRPWFSRLPNHETATIRQLLTHSAGLPDHVYLESFTQAYRTRWLETTNPFEPDALIEFVLDLPPLFEPGEGWAYSDTGYILVGLIIEEATGHSYYEEVTQRFLDPLQLTLTKPSNSLELPGLAAGYMSLDNRFDLPKKTTHRPGVMTWHPGFEWTGGGLISNSKDLVIWAKALFEGRAVEQPYLENLLTSVPVSVEHPTVQYGIGVGIYRETPFGPSYGHGGWIPGYSFSLRYYPDYGVAIAFQINTDIGIVDDSTPLIEDMENCLARVVIDSLDDGS